MKKHIHFKKMFLVPFLCAALWSAGPAATQAGTGDEVDQISKQTPDFIKDEKGTVYFKPSLGRLINMLIRMGSLDYREDAILDEYEMVHDCKVYNHFYKDEFRWRDVQKAARKSLEMNVPTFPMTFFYDATMRLSRYDFEAGLFRFESRGSGDGVNTFSISAEGEGRCGETVLRYLPVSFKIVLQHMFHLPGIKMTPAEAEALAKSMEASGNDFRIVFIRFKMRGLYAERFLFNVKDPRDPNRALIQGRMQAREARVDAALDAIELFQDEARTKLIKVIKP